MDAAFSWLESMIRAALLWLGGIPPSAWLVVGSALGVGATLLTSALRKAYIRRKLRRMWEKTPVLKRFAPESAAAQAYRTRQRRSNSKTDKIYNQKETLREREAKLAEMMGELRELMLILTEIIANTNNASGEATEIFNQAREALEDLETDSSDKALDRIRTILLSEISRMADSNVALKEQLRKAQRGITNQKEEIDKLRTKAHYDQLTQLLNRAAFDDCIQEMFENWKRTKEVFSLLMLDVDHFKDINDSYGHVHGDRLLKEIAQKIKDGVRDRDFPARYGGEEFAVILTDTHAEEALMVGTRIRESVERGFFQVDANQVRITISGGIAQSGTHRSIVDLVETADKALYQSKKRGRNRITLGGDHIKESWTSNQGR